MNCPLSQQDILFNLKQGLGYEERSLKLYEDHLHMLEGKELSSGEEEDKKIIARIAEDERRHIEVVKNLIRIVEESYIAE